MSSEGRMVRVDEASLEAGHEVSDARPGRMIFVLGILLVGIAIVFVVVTGFVTLLTGHLGDFRPPAGGVANVPDVQPAPAPRLETANGQVLAQVHARENLLLDQYAWIDQNAGVVRIPIDQAMQLLIQRGLPTAPQSQGATSGLLTRPSGSSSGRTQEETIP